MGKKERAAWSCTGGMVSLFMLGMIAHLSSAEDDSPQVVYTFFDPKFHDDGSDSLAMESGLLPNWITPSKGISFTTIGQNRQEQRFSSLPIFETGKFQEFHDVVPINEVSSESSDTVNMNNVRFTETKYPEPEPTKEAHYRQSSSSHSSHSSSGPDVMYAPERWIPNVGTFPDSDSTYTKPISSSPVVKWPGDDVTTTEDRDITPQMYDYVEPALSGSGPTPPAPTSTQYHHSSPDPKGYHFRITHSPILSSIGNYISSFSSLFRDLPKIPLIDSGGYNQFQQSQQPAVQSPQSSDSYTGYNSGGRNNPADSSSGYEYSLDTTNVNANNYYFAGPLNSFEGAFAGQQEGPQSSYKFTPIPENPIISTYDYGKNYPSIFSQHEASYPSTSYAPSNSAPGRPATNTAPKKYPPTPDKFPLKYENTYKPSQVVPTNSEIYSDEFPRDPVPGPTYTKGSLSSLYSSGEEFDGFTDVGDMTPTASYKGHTNGFGYGKPLKSYYTTPEDFYAILNDGKTSNHPSSSTKYSSSTSNYRKKPSYDSPPIVSVNYASENSHYNSYGISSYSPEKYSSTRSRVPVTVPYGSFKSPGSVSDEFLFNVQNSYGTPKDLKKPSTIGYYRTRQGSWARIPHTLKRIKGYNYKYQTTQQLPNVEDDPLLLDLPEDEAESYDGMNEEPDPECENKRDCGLNINNLYDDIAENVDITRRPKTMFTNSMFKKLMKNAVRRRRFRRPRKGRRNKNLEGGKAKRRRCRNQRCRKN